MCDKCSSNKDQLQCRTHGQKYLLGIAEIINEIKASTARKDQAKTMFYKKSSYHKMIKSVEDKKFLFSLFLRDQNSKATLENRELAFQDARSQNLFMATIPEFIMKKTIKEEARE